jgi:hypothetical protein
MKKTATALLGTLLASSLLAATALAGPWFAKGDFYCAPGCWNSDGGNEMFDDGLNGDGGPGDGIHGRTVVPDQNGGRHEYKVAMCDWSQSYHPFCNLWVWTAGPGDPVLFTYDTNVYADGWVPTTNIAWTDHYAPAGTMFEVIGSAPETGSWGSGQAANLSGGVWSRFLTVAAPGNYDYKFRAVGDWNVMNIGGEGGAPCGFNASYTTVVPNTDVLFEFNSMTGRVRAVVLGPTPTGKTSWGQLKTIYR